MNHLNVYANTGGVEVVALCDIILSKAQDKAKTYHVTQVFSDLESMSKLDLDLIDIVTPPASHSRLAESALESGHNVLVEKPMAVSSSECQRMVDAARRSGRTLCVTHNKRFFQSVRQAAAAIQKERIDVQRMRFSHFYPREIPKPEWISEKDSGGVLWDNTVHHVYLLEHFLGNTEMVYATGKEVGEGLYDSVTLVLQRAGKIGIGEFEWNSKDALAEFQIFGKQGDRFDGDLVHDYCVRRSKEGTNLTAMASKSIHDDVCDPWVKWTSHVRSYSQVHSFELALPFKRTFVTLIRELINFLAGNADSPPVTAQEGLQTVRTLEAAKKSIHTGRSEAVEQAT